MAKEALYFSHDSNAHRDPKIIAMRAVYGAEGYGWFWMLIEMMREADGYKLEMQSKYAFHAYALQLQCDSNAFASFVQDCMHEFNLFSSDGDYFWSESLLRRMLIKDERSEKAKKSAEARWKKTAGNANASENNANESKIDAYKVSKGKVSKGNKEYSEDTVSLTNYLIELMKSNNPNAKVPNNLDRWHDEMDKLQRIEKYEYMQIRSVISWCQQDDFWKGNILSAPKLREKMGTLIMQMQRPRNGTTNNGGKVSSFSKLQQMAREAEEREASGHY